AGVVVRRLLPFLLLFAACGRGDEFERADALERRSNYPAAVRAFERFAQAHPQDPRAPEALVRAAGIYARVFRRCPEAEVLYERAARGYPGAQAVLLSPRPRRHAEGGDGAQPWPDMARQGLFDCRNYFPLEQGARWEYADSQSGGRNMRLELEVISS